METRPPVVVTGQQIGVGWTPALSVVKALTALAVARSLGGQALYWMADEDHDQAEVASTVALEGDRLRRHRFQFHAAPGTATGWLPWTADHQREAEHLWGALPAPEGPTLRDHMLCLGEPLARRGLGFFSPTLWEERASLQAELEHWRSLDLETPLLAQAQRLRLEGAPLPLDPATQSAWFSLHPGNGRRRPLAPGEPCPSGHWLSPGAALRPLMQTRMLKPSHVVLGPAERAYWRLAEPLWERVGLEPPAIVPRPSVMVVPKGFQSSWLEPLRQGDWRPWPRTFRPCPAGCWEERLTKAGARPCRPASPRSWPEPVTASPDWITVCVGMKRSAAWDRNLSACARASSPSTSPRSASYQGYSGCAGRNCWIGCWNGSMAARAWC
ncbi:MAG: bacillithiol biosynthesis BshC [Firmicutes bacterium]|nr:bacillithiol biosynthesis BshC [Bacillota bacterium]